MYGISRTISDYDDVAARVRGVPGVVSAAPLVESQVLLNSGNYNAGGLVRGMTRHDLIGLHEVSDNLVAGSMDDFGDDDTIIVGTTLAERAGLTVGGRLTLVSPQGAATAFGTMPRVRAYRVVGIFDAGVNDYNAGYVFLPLHAAQVYFQLPGQVTQVQVMTRDAENVIPVRQAIEKAMNGDVRVMDWTQSNNAFFGAVQVEQNVMFLILTLIILVARSM